MVAKMNDAAHDMFGSIRRAVASAVSEYERASGRTVTRVEISRQGADWIVEVMDMYGVPRELLEERAQS
jgi:hypothetical protein